MEKFKKKLAFEHVFPISAGLLSMLACILFLRFYLIQSASQFKKDFTQQNMIELATGDSFQLVTRLNSLSETLPWICISGVRNKINFFQRIKSTNCSEGLFQTVIKIDSKNAEPISILLTLTLPKTLFFGGLVFFVLQGFILCFLFVSGRRTIIRTERARLEGKVQLANLAAQVAHDIRSPLAALAAVEQNLATLAEEQRIMVRKALNRIQDIANNLLQKNRENSGQNVPSHERIQDELLCGPIDEIVTEKRLQYRCQLDVTISAELNQSYGIFSKVNRSEFKRLLSNLISNSVESFRSSGAVLISLSTDKRNDCAVLSIRDNGTGISKEILSKLGRTGVSYGKVNGNGLGLAHARETIESWNGVLAIESEVGVGTLITISLPRTQAPNWFAPKLTLSNGHRIAIIDDDPSIHSIWSSRLKGYELLHFSGRSQLMNQHEEIKDIQLFLVDYELVENSETGLDLIQSLGISEKSILVTSRFEDESVRSEAIQLGVSIIPKGHASLIPIQQRSPGVPIKGSNQAFDAVLIDDDSLIQLTWAALAKSRGKKLKVFQSAQAFLEEQKTFDRMIPIYIDSHLGAELAGEDIARQLYEELGFTQLFLATGYEASHFAPMPWIKDVIGKKPPF